MVPKMFLAPITPVSATCSLAMLLDKASFVFSPISFYSRGNATVQGNVLRGMDLSHPDAMTHNKVREVDLIYTPHNFLL